MTTEPQCQRCWFTIETKKERELVCARKEGPCLGKIVEPLHKCKLFLARAENTQTARPFVEKMKDHEAFRYLKAMGRHVCKET